MTSFDKGLITVVACAFLFAALALPLIFRKVPRNVVYGFRTRATLSDDALWYEANAHFGRGLLIASFISALAVFILYRTQGFSAKGFFNASVVALLAPPAIAGLATAPHIRSLKGA